MNLPGWLHKGLGFLLMSFGVSSPTKKPKPKPGPAPKGAGQGQGSEKSCNLRRDQPLE